MNGKEKEGKLPDKMEKWWKSTNSPKEWVLPNGKKIRQTTLDMYQLCG